MKNNILHRFAIKDLKTHALDSWIAFFTILLVSMIVMTVTTYISPLFTHQQLIAIQKQEGTYDYYTTDDFTMENIQDLSQWIDDPSIETCIVIDRGVTLNDESINEFNGNNDIVATHLKMGRMPENEKEIAVKGSVLDYWGYKDTLQQTITLGYTRDRFVFLINDQFQYHFGQDVAIDEYKVVGILEETGFTDIAVKNNDQGLAKLYLQCNQTQYIDENIFTPHHYPNEDQILQTPLILMMIELTLIFISSTLLHGITLSSFEKRQKDYTLLRSIGITQRQLYYIIFVQSCLLTFFPLLLSILLLIISYFICSSFTLFPITISLSLSRILWNCLEVLIIVFISYFLPARSATYKALTGTFDNQEFQYFYYRYHKLHHMRPLYLAWRQLMGLKKKMLAKIFFMTVITIFSMNIITHYYMVYVQSLSETTIQPQISVLRYDEGNQQVNIHINDIEIFRPYVQDIIYEHHTYYQDNNHSLQIFCMNEKLKQDYSLKDIQPGQIIISDQYNPGLHIHDEMIIDNHHYEIIQIIPHINYDMAILCEDDYQYYGSLTDYQMATLLFENTQQKMQMLLQCAQEYVQVSKKYEVYNTLESQPYQYQYNDDTSIIKNVFLMIGFAFIYIYQFSFELMKQKEDIGTYQLLGLTHHEIYQIYFYKSCIISTVAFILGSLYHYLDTYAFYQATPYISMIYQPLYIFILIVMTCLILAIIIFFSMITLTSVLKTSGLENKMMNRE